MVPSRDGAVYLVLNDFGKFGQAYRETDRTQAGLQTDSSTSFLHISETDCMAGHIGFEL
jgi:hypothetical protein